MDGRTDPIPQARRVGAAAVLLIPLAHADGVYRFALLPQVLALQAVALAGVGAWLWRGGGAWRRCPLTLPAVAFLLAEAVSIFAAINRVAGLLPVATHAGYVFLFLVLLNGLDVAGLRAVLRVAGAVAGAISALGMAQYLGWAADWVPSAGLPSGTLGHRNIAAAYLVGVLPLTFWAWAEAKGRLASLLWGVALGLQGAFLLATRSRGAWVGLCIALVLTAVPAVLARRRSKAARRPLGPFRAASLLVAALIAVVPAAVPADIEKGVGEAMWEGKRSIGASVASVVQAGGDKGRLALWQRTLEMIADRPVWGVGAGNWRLAYPAYSQGDLVEARIAPHRPHNDFLWIWAEAGAAGIGAYLFLLWTAGRLGLGLVRGSGDRLLAGALLCSLAAAVANSAFGFPREFPAAWMPFYLGLAGLGVLRGAPAARRSAAARAVLWGGAAVLLAGAWVGARQVGFDRHALWMRVAVAQSRWPDAIREADRALAWGPFDEEAYLMRGRAYAALDAPARARADYLKGLAYHPNSVGLWHGLGNALRSMGDRAGAYRAYRKALALDPKSGEVYNNIGTLHAMEGRMDSALAAYRMAVACQADLPDVYANLSIVYRRQGDLERSLAAAEQALERDPDHPEALNALGSACMAAGRFDAAAGAFSKALAADSTRAEVYYNLGRAHEDRGDRAAAYAAYAAFFRHWKGPDGPRAEAVRRRLRAVRQGD